MILRYAGAALATVYGLLLGYIVVAQALFYGFAVAVNWRVPLVLLALAGASAVYLGKSTWFLVGALALVTLWRGPEIVDHLMAVILGVWGYSRMDLVSFPLIFLPPTALLLSLLADGRAKKLFHAVRTWPHEDMP
ncbi:MAG TPA: hypothetical protein VGG10_06080 [Rhizomicrobium sp.]|jgi:hypothetical protein